MTTPDTKMYLLTLTTCHIVLYDILTLILLQDASRICASCEAGVRFDVEPKGEIIDDMARFSFDGVLLKDSARPTYTEQQLIQIIYLNGGS